MGGLRRTVVGMPEISWRSLSHLRRRRLAHGRTGFGVRILHAIRHVGKSRRQRAENQHPGGSKANRSRSKHGILLTCEAWPSRTVAPIVHQTRSRSRGSRGTCRTPLMSRSDLSRATLVAPDLKPAGLEKPGINALASQEAPRYKSPRPRAFPGPFLRPALDFKGLA